MEKKIFYNFFELGDFVYYKPLLPDNPLRKEDLYLKRLQCKIVGFEELAIGRNSEKALQWGIKPGIYKNLDKVKIKIPLIGGETVWVRRAYDLEHCNKKVAKERAVALKYLRDKYKNNEVELARKIAEKNFIRDLPETPFWEDDLVEMKRVFAGSIYRIIDIDYVRLREIIYKDEEMEIEYSAYKIINLEGKTKEVNKDEIKLLVRGKYWKKAHDADVLLFHPKTLHHV